MPGGPTHRALRAAWLIAALLAACAALAGCKSKTPPDLRAEVTRIRGEMRSVVADSTRAAQVTAVFDRFDSVLVKSVDHRRAIGARFRDLYRRYDTPRDTLEALIAEQAGAASAFREQAMIARDDVRKLTTGDEWKKLGKGRKELMNLYAEGGQ